MLFFWIVFLFYLVLKGYQIAKKSHLMKALCSGLLLLLAIAAVYLGSLLFQNLEGITVFKRFFQLLEGENTSGITRLAMVNEGLTLWMQSPFMGNGIDQFRVLGSYGTYAHNNYIELLCDFGISGLFLYYFSYFVITAKSIKGIVAGYEHAYFALMMIVTMALWEVGVVSYSEKSMWLMMVLAFHLVSAADAQKADS
jgi:O-antigen ligase